MAGGIGYDALEAEMNKKYPNNGAGDPIPGRLLGIDYSRPTALADMYRGVYAPEGLNVAGSATAKGGAVASARGGFATPPAAQTLSAYYGAPGKGGGVLTATGAPANAYVEKTFGDRLNPEPALVAINNATARGMPAWGAQRPQFSSLGDMYGPANDPGTTDWSVANPGMGGLSGPLDQQTYGTAPTPAPAAAPQSSNLLSTLANMFAPVAPSALQRQAQASLTPAGGFKPVKFSGESTNVFGQDNAFQPRSVQTSARFQTGY